MTGATIDHEVETAAAVIEDLLYLVPAEKRAAVLARATELEAHQRTGGAFVIFDAGDLSADSPSLRCWSGIMRLKARLIYTFVRNITNNHAPQDAANLLFSQQRGRPGSGYLEHYIGRIWPLRPGSN
jgi:hypothetical protein